MMLSRLWGRITGKDKDLKYPDQQAVFLGRVGDYTVVFPYGLYSDLPNNTLLKELTQGVAVPVTVQRPVDTEQGEPTFFHPATNTRIIARNNGDLDIVTTDQQGSVNVKTVNVNLEASGNVNAEVGGDINVNAAGAATITAATSTTIDTPETTATGNVIIQGNLTVAGSTSLGSTVTSNGKNISDSHTHVGVTPGGGNSGPPL